MNPANADAPQVSPGPPKATRYQAVQNLGVVSFALGLLSVLALLDWFWGVVPLAGITVGYLALRRIRRNPEETTGEGFAKTGIRLSGAMWLAGLVWLTYLSLTGTPPGYVAITYAQLQPGPEAPPHQLVPPSAEELHGQRVFVRGYMMPGKQQSGIKRFFLINDPGVCAFGDHKPKITQMIEVKLLDELETEYTTQIVGVGGKFRVESGKPKKDEDKQAVVRGPDEKGGQPEPEKPGGGVLYQIEADYLR